MLTVNAAWNALNFRRELLLALLEDQHRVTILAPQDDTVGELEALGCRFIDLQMSVTGLNPLVDLALVPRFRRIFERERPDVILSYTIKNNIFASLAARGRPWAVLPNVTGLGTAFLSGGLLERLSRYLYRIAFAKLPVVFFQNAEDQTLFLQRGLVDEQHARLLCGSGINLARFSPTPLPKANAPVFLMIGRLLEQKGIYEYVEAARVVRREQPDSRFQVLGSVDSANRSAVTRKVLDDWIAEGVIEYLGSTSDVRPFLEAAHCVVLPSWREGAPRTLLEAGAAGRPVIATDVPGCRAVVEADVTGFLCRVRSAAALAEACRRFSALPAEHRQQMGAAGRSRMERHFDVKEVVAAYRRAIAEVTSSAPPEADSSA